MELEDLVEEIRSSDGFHRSGCIVTFTGVVRGETDDEEVKHLEFESYDGVTGEFMRRLEEELAEREEVVEVRMRHETGRLEVGEDIVHIAVAAAHRDEGFAVCREAIDRLKESVPIWKKEVTAEGERWTHETG